MDVMGLFTRLSLVSVFQLIVSDLQSIYGRFCRLEEQLGVGGQVLHM